jgi:hypothetical protein
MITILSKTMEENERRRRAVIASDHGTILRSEQ